MKNLVSLRNCCHDQKSKEWSSLRISFSPFVEFWLYIFFVLYIRYFKYFKRRKSRFLFLCTSVHLIFFCDYFLYAINTPVISILTMWRNSFCNFKVHFVKPHSYDWTWSYSSELYVREEEWTNSGVEVDHIIEFVCFLG